ncbi:hypothetical protein [Streptomyces sp. NPDC046985]|uniref:hypothetical protein n=1 Tax=Streptomyces sp. NPDC046985 TaxID=3155377 RepID=UPI0033D1A041
MSDSVPETEVPAPRQEDAEAAADPAYDPAVDPAHDRAVDPAHAPAGDPAHAPAAPAPLHVPRTPTGESAVDAALERLGDVDRLAADGHAAVYEDVHRGLRDALTALDERPGPPPPAPAPARPHQAP